MLMDEGAASAKTVNLSASLKRYIGVQVIVNAFTARSRHFDYLTIYCMIAPS